MKMNKLFLASILLAATTVQCRLLRFVLTSGASFAAGYHVAKDPELQKQLWDTQIERLRRETGG